MQRVETQRKQAQQQSASRHGGATHAESMQGAPIKQLQTTLDSDPQLEKQRNLAATINTGSAMSAQRKFFDGIHNSPAMIAQRKHLASLFGTAQRVKDEEPLQPKLSAEAPAQLEQQSTVKPNNTGLPDNLKSGIENLSGMSMDNVKVHYNSSQPAQLNALAYAQGTDIHVAPGQEQHLPHEAWHVVQQAQGRVRPTMQMKEGIHDLKPAPVTFVHAIPQRRGLETRTPHQSTSIVQRVIDAAYTPHITRNIELLQRQREQIQVTLSDLFNAEREAKGLDKYRLTTARDALHQWMQGSVVILESAHENDTDSESLTNLVMTMRRGEKLYESLNKDEAYPDETLEALIERITAGEVEAAEGTKTIAIKGITQPNTVLTEAEQDKVNRFLALNETTLAAGDLEKNIFDWDANFEKVSAGWSVRISQGNRIEFTRAMTLGTITYTVFSIGKATYKH